MLLRVGAPRRRRRPSRCRWRRGWRPTAPAPQYYLLAAPDGGAHGRQPGAGAARAGLAQPAPRTAGRGAATEVLAHGTRAAGRRLPGGGARPRAGARPPGAPARRGGLGRGRGAAARPAGRGADGPRRRRAAPPRWKRRWRRWRRATSAAASRCAPAAGTSSTASPPASTPRSDRLEELMATLRQVTDDVAHDLRTPLSRLRQRLEAARARRDARSRASRARSRSATASSASSRRSCASPRWRAAAPAPPSRASTFPASSRPWPRCTAPPPRSAAKRWQRASRPAWLAWGDRELVTQMLANLVENAVRHGREGGRVEVALERAPAGAPWRRWPTTAPASPPPSASACSGASTAWTRRGRRPAPASASPWRRRSPTCTGCASAVGQRAGPARLGLRPGASDAGWADLAAGGHRRPSSVD